MRAAVVTGNGGPAAVEVRSMDVPRAAPDQVLIDVAAAGVTYPDVLLTRGEYQLKPPPPFVPGCELAGTIRSCPPGSPWHIGQRVAALTFLGGFAEVAAVSADRVFELPTDMPFTTAAALPMNYLTMHFGLTLRAGLRPGETVLVHGAGGGIGTAAIQLARAMGASVIAVVSSEEKANLARTMGAQHVTSPSEFREAVGEITDGRGVDVVVDPVGGERFLDSLRCLGPLGRILVIGFAGGGDIPVVKVNRLLLANTSVIGVAWGAFCRQRTGYPAEQWRELFPWIRDGRLEPPVGGVYELDDVAAALSSLEERRMLGRAVIRISDSV